MEKFFLIPSPFDGRGIWERVNKSRGDLIATAPSLLPSLPQIGERGKTNPSVSPFRKGRNKNEKFFNSPLF